MIWRYIASRKRVKGILNPELQHIWEVREYYYPDEEGGHAWTEDAIEPFGTSREELIQSLEMMLEDVKRGDYLDLDEEKVTEVE